jgi:hypothetical protein
VKQDEPQIKIKCKGMKVGEEDETKNKSERM